MGPTRTECLLRHPGPRQMPGSSAALNPQPLRHERTLRGTSAAGQPLRATWKIVGEGMFKIREGRHGAEGARWENNPASQEGPRFTHYLLVPSSAESPWVPLIRASQHFGRWGFYYLPHPAWQRTLRPKEVDPLAQGHTALSVGNPEPVLLPLTTY